MRSIYCDRVCLPTLMPTPVTLFRHSSFIRNSFLLEQVPSSGIRLSIVTLLPKKSQSEPRLENSSRSIDVSCLTA